MQYIRLGWCWEHQSSRSEDKTLRYNVQGELVWCPARTANLEIVLLGFASHDDVERLVRVFGATLNTAGHVLLILIGVQPHTECSVVSFQLGLWFRTYFRRTKKGPLLFLWWKNTEEAGIIMYLCINKDYDEGLSTANTGFMRGAAFAVFRYLDRFFKQGTEQEVKVNPIGLCWERLSGAYVGVCHCARAYCYAGIVKSPY